MLNLYKVNNKKIMILEDVKRRHSGVFVWDHYIYIIYTIEFEKAT